jgi:chaperonin GroES
MKTTYDNVIIEPVDPDNVSNGGIVIMYDLDVTHNRGVVVDIGPGRISKDGNTIPMTVKVGDSVLFPLKGGVNINIDGKSRVIIKEEEIFAILDE